MAHRDFNQLYIEMRTHIYRLSAGITGCGDDAEDIVQDLYEKLWRRRLVVMAHRNPKGYILTAARNLCLDRLRGRKNTSEISPAIAAEKGCGEDERDMSGIAAQLMAALPEKQRTVMHLRDVECMEIDEIAQVMNINETAVRMSLSRARSTVREQLIKIMNHGI